MMKKALQLIAAVVLILAINGCERDLAAWEQGEDVRNSKTALSAVKVSSNEKDAMVFLAKWVDVCNRSDTDTLKQMIYLSSGEPEKKFMDTLKQVSLYMILTSVEITEEKSNRIICRSVLSSYKDKDNLIVVDFTLTETPTGFKMSNFKPYKGEYYQALGKELQNKTKSRFGTDNLSQFLGYSIPQN